jgi:DNA-damage-inducible protein J
MAKSSIISARIDPDLKHDTELILSQLGLTPSQAITLFYRQVTLHEGLPFPVSLPNAKTRQALREAQERYRLETFDTVDDLFEDLQA